MLQFSRDEITTTHKLQLSMCYPSSTVASCAFRHFLNSEHAGKIIEIIDGLDRLGVDVDSLVLISLLLLQDGSGVMSGTAMDLDFFQNWALPLWKSKSVKGKIAQLEIIIIQFFFFNLS